MNAPIPVELPALRDYLAVLPDGLRSFPEYVCKASLITNLVEQSDLPRALVRQLPDTLRVYWDAPPPVSAWVPEVHLVGVMLAHLDPVFAGDEERFVRWFYDVAMRLYRKPLYRMLFFVMSPKRLLKGFVGRYTTFHRGLVAEISEERDGFVRFRMRDGAGCYPRVVARTSVVAVLAAVEAAGGRDVRGGKLEVPERGVYEFDITWS